VSTTVCSTATDLPKQVLPWIQVARRISVEIPSARGRAGCLPKRAQSRRCAKAAAPVDLLKLRGFLRMAFCKARDSKAQDGQLTGIVAGKRHSPIFANITRVTVTARAEATGRSVCRNAETRWDRPPASECRRGSSLTTDDRIPGTGQERTASALKPYCLCEGQPRSGTSGLYRSKRIPCN
jgi:hypothetical protein